VSRRAIALIFDFDGLILDTETPEVRAWQQIFRDHGCEFPDSWWINAIGRGADQIFETPLELLARTCAHPIDEEQVSRTRSALFAELMDKEDARPGVRSLIEEARGASIPLGVASSSKHPWVDGFLKRLGLFESFDAIVCADDVARAKPHPDLYLAAMAAIGIDPEHGIALEDSPNGIRAAKAAGLTCVAVPNDLTGRLDLSHADHAVTSLANISLDGLIRLV
jgi:HAD superfamily hydrolase (TIGR01509 family)